MFLHIGSMGGRLLQNLIVLCWKVKWPWLQIYMGNLEEFPSLSKWCLAAIHFVTVNLSVSVISQPLQYKLTAIKSNQNLAVNDWLPAVLAPGISKQLGCVHRSWTESRSWAVIAKAKDGTEGFSLFYCEADLAVTFSSESIMMYEVGMMSLAKY